MLRQLAFRRQALPRFEDTGFDQSPNLVSNALVKAACGKRPISENLRVAIVDQIEEHVHRNFDREVPTSVIGELVCTKLRDIDEVAYIRFASEYHQFKDVGELVASVRELTMRVKDVKGQDKLF